MPIILDELTPLTATFELRYAPQFAVWDRSGTIWSTMAAEYPAITPKKAEPNNVSVTLIPHLDAVVGIDRTHLTVRQPEFKLDALKAAAATLVPILVKELPIEQFTRIGLRLIYLKVFDDRDDAARYLRNTVSIPTPMGKVMNVDGRLRDPSYSFQWEGDTLGFMMRLSANQTQLNVELPPEYYRLIPSTNELTINRFNVDIDYYSHAQVSVDKLKPDDLIDNWLHVIRRDIEHVISS